MDNPFKDQGNPLKRLSGRWLTSHFQRQAESIDVQGHSIWRSSPLNLAQPIRTQWFPINI
jgi:hypothetical protein